jgi:hypothetical protein
MKKYTTGILVVAAALFLGSLTACSPSKTTATSPTSVVASATPVASAPAAELKPSSTPTPTPGASHAKEYEKLERTRKRAEVQKKIEAFLTQDQVKQFDSKLQQGEKMRQALSGLNLTTEQNTKIQEVFKSGHKNSDKADDEPVKQ